MIYPIELSSPSAWISLGTFMACVFSIIISPRVPIFLHKRHFQKLKSSRRQDEESKPTIELGLETESCPINYPLIREAVQEPNFYWITLDMAIAPIIALFFLFTMKCMRWDDFFAGINGDDKICPYGITILFMSLSYACISLNTTGFFEYIAKVLIKKSAGRGHFLFFSFALFASILTLFTSNDIVILALTPICCFLSKNSKNLDLIPFVVCQFFMANVWSIAFQIGNTTNVIVAEAYNLHFLKFLMYMGLPAITAGTISFVMLYLIFFKRIPVQIISTNDEGPMPTLKNKYKAIIKTVGILLILVILMITSLVPLPDGSHMPAYVICLAFGVIFLISDLITDLIKIRNTHWEHFRDTLFQESQTIQVIMHMPWKVIPFVFGMFVMVELLNRHGFVTLIASFLNDVISASASADSDTSFSSILTACFVISILSTLACNVMSGQPMTIFFTKILLSPAFVQDPTLQKAASLSLILGSNLGANVTLIGALAGILWHQILKDNGVSQKEMNYWVFLKYGLCVTPLALAGSTFVITREILEPGY